MNIQANAVPNYAEVLLDIRNANPNLTISDVWTEIDLIASKLKVKVVNQKTNLNLASYLIDDELFSKFTDIAVQASKGKLKRVNLGKVGFFESAIISKAWNCACISFGPYGIPHDENEFVDIKSLLLTKEVFKATIKSYNSVKN